MSELFIKKEDLEILIDIFKTFCPDAEVYAYGSRLNGRAHSGSDLDLTLKNFPKDKYLFELKEQISESNVTFLVDINEYDKLPEAFQIEIDRNCKRIF